MKKEVKLQKFCNPVTGQVVEAETIEQAQELMKQNEKKEEITKEDSNE